MMMKHNQSKESTRRTSCTAGLYAASTLGLLALSGTIHLNAQMKTLPAAKYDKSKAPVATSYSTEQQVESLNFEQFELSAAESRLNADQLVQKAATANKSADYEKAVAYYLEAIKIGRAQV